VTQDYFAPVFWVSDVAELTDDQVRFPAKISYSNFELKDIGRAVQTDCGSWESSQCRDNRTDNFWFHYHVFGRNFDIFWLEK
jgi:hypothetical protein